MRNLKVKEHYSYSTALKRKSHPDNWDFTVSCDIDLGELFTLSLRVVMDGVSSSNGGEATECAYEVLSEYLIGQLSRGTPQIKKLLSLGDEDTVERILYNAVYKAITEANSAVSGIGACTIALAIAVGERLYTANLGDSPIYLIDITNGYELVPMYKLGNRAGELIESGEITVDEAVTHSASSELLAGLGISRDISDINWGSCPLPEKSILMVGSDGALGELTREAMRKLMKRHSRRGLELACEKLKAEVIKSGGHDDFTVTLDIIEARE